MNCPKCNFNNAFGNYCRKCGSSLQVSIAFPSKNSVVPNNKSGETLNSSLENKKSVPNSSRMYQQQNTLNSSNRWFK